MTQTKKKIGRPALPVGEARTVFAVRLSTAEKKVVEQAAKKAGRPVTQWARETLLSAA